MTGRWQATEQPGARDRDRRHRGRVRAGEDVAGGRAGVRVGTRRRRSGSLALPVQAVDGGPLPPVVPTVVVVDPTDLVALVALAIPAWIGVDVPAAERAMSHLAETHADTIWRFVRTILKILLVLGDPGSDLRGLGGVADRPVVPRDPPSAGPGRVGDPGRCAVRRGAGRFVAELVLTATSVPTAHASGSA